MQKSKVQRNLILYNTNFTDFKNFFKKDIIFIKFRLY